MTKKTKRVIKMPVNGVLVDLDYAGKGYYLGELRVGYVPFHVEAIAVTVEDNGGDNGGVVVSAKNPIYQNRIDSWLEKNEGCTPRLVEDEGGPYFINIEVYAA